MADANRSTDWSYRPAGWWVYGISGVIALQYLNVPMFSAFRRFTTLIVMVGEYKLRNRLPPRNQQVPISIPPWLRSDKSPSFCLRSHAVITAHARRVAHD